LPTHYDNQFTRTHGDHRLPWVRWYARNTMIIHADILDWCNTYDGPKFHAAMMDAPYELREIPESELDAIIANMDYETGAKGFMGRKWDGTGLVFRPALWRAIAAHLHPGAFLFVAGGTLNDDLICLAMRRAGLRKHHKALAWSYGSGFPKATRIDTQVDAAAGVERETISTRKHAPKWAAAELGYREKDNGYNSRERESFDVTAPATDLARRWEGHRYGMQCLKPSVEPILVFQKPYVGRPVDCITTTGAGALNIDAGRLATADDTGRKTGRLFGGMVNPGGIVGGETEAHELGRWPANLVLGHAPDCTADQCVPACAVRRLGEQSGERPSGGANLCMSGPNTDRIKTDGRDGDTGSASRYFFNADWTLDRLEAADPVFYCAKASTAEREAGLAGFSPTTVDDGRTTPIDNPYLRGETTRRNTHATIKPLSLNRHLASLLLPPPDYGPRRLLIPFGGVYSEGIGAELAGWEEVVAVELEAEHVAIGQARLAWWREMARKLGTDDPATILAMADDTAEATTIFDLLDAA
jgi:hypothetical protein